MSTRKSNRVRAVQISLTSAQEVAAKLCKDLEDSLPMVELARQANKLADAVIEPVISASTCKQGCSHCCQQSVIMIDQADAVVLASATGREMSIPDPNDKRNYRGVPCVFLDTTTNSCTVYEHRPMTCRISLSADVPYKCKTEEHRQMVIIESVYSQMVQLIGPKHLRAYDLSRGSVPSADIRQFFKPD